MLRNELVIDRQFLRFGYINNLLIMNYFQGEKKKNNNFEVNYDTNFEKA